MMFSNDARWHISRVACWSHKYSLSPLSMKDAVLAFRFVKARCGNTTSDLYFFFSNRPKEQKMASQSKK